MSSLRKLHLLLLLAAALLAGACAPWAQSNPNDPERCEPACVAGKKCFNGACAALPADAGPDAADLIPDVAADLPPPDKPALDVPAPDKAKPDAPEQDAPKPDLPPPDKAKPDLPPPDMPAPDKTKPDAALPCGKITFQGCCDGEVLMFCQNNKLNIVNCIGEAQPKCGWNSSSAFYDCGTSGGSDPKGKHPKTCPGKGPDSGPPDSAPPDSAPPDAAPPDMPKPCGDKKINGGELCDGALLGGKTCKALGFIGGTLKCKADCSDFDTSGCHWVVTAGGLDDDLGMEIAAEKTSYKDLYITGSYKKTATFGGTTLSAKGSPDMFVARLDTTGKFSWVVSAGGTGGKLTEPRLAVDKSGNTTVTGLIQGSYTASFGKHTLSSSGTNVFLTRLDPSGKFLWVNKAGGTSSSAAVDSVGNSYVSGYFSSTATFGSLSVTSKGITDAFVAKADSSGKYQWVTGGGSVTGADHAFQMVLDGSGNSYITGDFMGTATFGSTTLTTKKAYDVDVFVAKLDTTGKFAWAVSAGGSTGSFAYDIGRGIDFRNGGIYVTGFYTGSAAFGSTTLTSKGSVDLFVAKLDTKGNFVWATSAGGAGQELARAIFVDGAGKAVVSGVFQGSATFGSTTLTSKGSTDVFVTLLDPSGKIVWATSAGGTGGESVEGISYHSPGRLCVIGGFSGTATFEGKAVTSKGGKDVFIWRTAPPAGP